MDALPYYKWQWRDYRANRKVQRMSWQAKGLYRELLDEVWSEGVLPNDHAALADICGCTVEEFGKYWPEIAPCWTVTANGLCNPKMDEQRTAKDQERIAKSMAGRSGGLVSNSKTRQEPTKASASDVQASASEPQAQPDIAEQEQSRAEQEQRAREPAPLSNPEVVSLVDRIVVMHPRSQMRSLQFSEVTYAQRVAVVQAMQDESKLAGCSRIAALEMILAQVTRQATESPPSEHRFFKDVEPYFARHEYRIEPQTLRRKDAGNGKTGSKSFGTGKAAEAESALLAAHAATDALFGSHETAPDSLGDDVPESWGGDGRSSPGVVLEGHR